MATYPPSPLFGGALCACLPPGWLDASDLRPVPDNQEVFFHPGARDDPASTAPTPTLTFELLERASDVPDGGLAEFLLEDYASTCGALARRTTSLRAVAPADAPAWVTAAEAAVVARAYPPGAPAAGAVGGVLTARLSSLHGSAWVRGGSEAAAGPDDVALALAVLRVAAPYNSDILVVATAPAAWEGATGEALAERVLKRALSSLAMVDLSVFQQ